LENEGFRRHSPAGVRPGRNGSNPARVEGMRSDGLPSSLMKRGWTRMRLQGLLPIVLGLRLLVPSQFLCDITDAKQPGEPAHASDHQATASDHHASHDHHPVESSHDHASEEAPAPRAGHCGSESEEHGCHDDGDSCACAMLSVALVQSATNSKSQLVKVLSVEAIAGSRIIVADAARAMTRAGPDPSQFPRSSPSRTPDCTRAPPALA